MSEGNETFEHEGKVINRRRVMQVATHGTVAAAAGAVGAYLESKFGFFKTKPPNPNVSPSPSDQEPFSTAEPLPTQEPKAEITKKLRLGEKEVNVDIFKSQEVQLPIKWYPDGHSSFIKTPEGFRVFLSGGPYGYTAEGRDLNNLGKTTEILGPSGKDSFDRNYAAPGSIVPGKNPGELIMFYHGEYHYNQPNHFPFKAGIGLATSKDNGKTWERKGQIINGQDEKYTQDHPRGAGQPSAIIKDGYIYLYYVDWNSRYSDSVHLARSPMRANGETGSWEKYYEGSFRTEGMSGRSSPVITAEKGDYSALPGVSFNSHLNKFLTVYESTKGFDVVTSDDGIAWSDPQRLLDITTGNNNPKNGQAWNSYPTLWSPNKDSDRETDNNMILVYSEGKYNQGPHSMRTREIKLS